MSAISQRKMLNIKNDERMRVDSGMHLPSISPSSVFFLSNSFWFDFIDLTNLVTTDLSNLWKVKYSKFLHEFSVEWQNIDVYGICYFSKKRNYHNFCRTGSSAVGTANFPKLKKIRKDNKLKKRYLRHDLVEYLSGLKIRG